MSNATSPANFSAATARLVSPEDVAQSPLTGQVRCDFCRGQHPTGLALDLPGINRLTVCEPCREPLARALAVLLLRPATPWAVDARHPLARNLTITRNGQSETGKCFVLTADEATGVCTAIHVGEEPPHVRHPDYDIITDLPWAVVRVVVHA